MANLGKITPQFNDAEKQLTLQGDGNIIDVNTKVIALPDFFGENGLFETLADGCDLQIFETEAVRLAIRFYWESFGRRHYIRNLKWYMALLFCVTAGLFFDLWTLIGESFTQRLEMSIKNPVKHYTFFVSRIFLAIGLCISASYIIREFNEILFDIREKRARIDEKRKQLENTILKRQTTLGEKPASSKDKTKVSPKNGKKELKRKKEWVILSALFEHFTRTVWDFLEPVTYVIIFSSCSFTIFGLNSSNILNAMAMLLAWITLLAHARGFKVMGSLLNKLLRIFRDMGMYTIVQLVVLIGFALSFKVLMPGKAEWYNWTAFVTVFRLMIGDADDMEPFLPALNDDTILDPKLYAGTETVAIILWMVYTGVIVIVMINMLIAQMSDSFDRAQEVENALALQERARVISQIIRYNIRSNEKGCCMRKRKRNYNIFPKWLYVLLPSDKTLKLRRQTQQQWTGRLKSIKNNMDIAIATLSEKLMTALEKSTAAARTDNAVLKELLLKTPSSDGSVNTGALQDQNKQLKDELTKTVEKSVNNLRNDIGENQGKFTERIGGLEKNVDDLKANVDKILELLAKNTEKTS